MAEEFVDVLNERGENAGVKAKSEAHAKGLWHKAVYVWMYNSKGEVMLQKRAKTKQQFPGLWDTSLSGHVSSGEDFEDAAVRELREELDIRVTPGALKRVASRKVEYDDEKLNYHNREIVTIYLYKLDKLPTRLQKEETDEVKFVPIAEFEKELADPDSAKKYTPWDYSEMISTIRKALKARADAEGGKA